MHGIQRPWQVGCRYLDEGKKHGNQSHNAVFGHNMLKYVKAAFLNRWNLLAFLGAFGAALISGQPDVMLPIVLAGEAAYLGFVGTHPKYQKYVDINQAQAVNQANTQQNELVLQRIRQSLPAMALERFNTLRDRCQKLRQIASDLKHPRLGDVDSSLDAMQIEGLDRLLWVFLRLLFTQHSLQQFLDNTSLENMQEDKRALENRLAAEDSKDMSERSQKIRHALEDNLQTVEDRISDYHRAEENSEFVELEIDRLENKIKSLAEMAVNRQEPDFISSQVDQVASSMKHAENTMNDLQFATGLGAVDEQVPELMEEIYEIQ